MKLFPSIKIAHRAIWFSTIILSLCISMGCQMPTEPNTLQQEKSFTVKFNPSGGTSIPDQIVKDGGLIVKPDNPIKPGYKFIEWMSNESVYDFSTPVTKDLVLVADWYELKTFTITFDSDGGTDVASINVKESFTVTKPIDPTLENYTFKEWTLDGLTYDFLTPVTKDLVLKAIWVNAPVITFDSMGGSSVDSQTIYDGKVTKPVDPTNPPHFFKGWVDSSGNLFDFENTVVTRGITLTATWTKTIEDNVEYYSENIVYQGGYLYLDKGKITIDFTTNKYVYKYISRTPYPSGTVVLKSKATQGTFKVDSNGNNSFTDDTTKVEASYKVSDSSGNSSIWTLVSPPDFMVFMGFGSNVYTTDSINFALSTTVTKTVLLSHEE